MKTLLTIIRWIVGLLFIFSGLIKANDPLGLGYKMQEFFEVWGWNFLNNYTLLFSLLMNVFEVLAGVAVIVGWRMKLFSWLLLLLIIFFTFLTGFALFSGKIKTCGCFGDCLPLTPFQSFIKDLLLLVLILVLFIYKKNIQPTFKPIESICILLISVFSVSGLQRYVLKHLPLLDCLPYKTGNNIAEQMQLPAGSVPDSFVITFRYKKSGKNVEFDSEHFPADFDSSYELVDRYDKLVRKGNAVPPINDFSLQTIQGKDTTAALFNQTQFYVLVFVQNFSNWHKQEKEFHQLIVVAKEKKIPVFIVTPMPEDALKLIDNTVTILRNDATVLKTAARVNSTYYLMKGSVIIGKKSFADVEAFTSLLNKESY